MADVSLTIRIQGTPEVLAALKQVTGQAQATGAQVQQLGVQQQKTADATVGAFSRARQGMLAFSSALAGTAAIASILARNNAQLQRQLEVLSLTLAGAGTAARTMAAGLRLVVAVVGAKIAILGTAIAAVVLLVRNWDQAKAAAIRIWGDIAAFFRRVFAAIGTAGRGLGEILLGALTFNIDRIRAGWNTLTSGLRELGGIAVGLGRSVFSLMGAGWDKLQGLFGQTAVAAGGAAKGIKDATDAVREWLSEQGGLIASLKDAGRLWEGLASEAERAAGRMGRSSITVTMDRYGHLMPSAFEGVGERLDALLQGTSKAPTTAGRTNAGPARRLKPAS